MYVHVRIASGEQHLPPPPYTHRIIYPPQFLPFNLNPPPPLTIPSNDSPNIYIERVGCFIANIIFNMKDSLFIEYARSLIKSAREANLPTGADG